MDFVSCKGKQKEEEEEAGKNKAPARSEYSFCDIINADDPCDTIRYDTWLLWCGMECTKFQKCFSSSLGF